MNYPMALVISVGFISLSIVACKLLEEYFYFNRSRIEAENRELKKEIERLQEKCE